MASCIDPCSGPSLVLAQNRESYWVSWDYTWFGSLGEGVGRAAKTHHCRGAGLMGSGYNNPGQQTLTIENEKKRVFSMQSIDTNLNNIYFSSKL